VQESKWKYVLSIHADIHVHIWCNKYCNKYYLIKLDRYVSFVVFL